MLNCNWNWSCILCVHASVHHFLCHSVPLDFVVRPTLDAFSSLINIWVRVLAGRAGWLKRSLDYKELSNSASSDLLHFSHQEHASLSQISVGINACTDACMPGRLPWWCELISSMFLGQGASKSAVLMVKMHTFSDLESICRHGSVHAEVSRGNEWMWDEQRLIIVLVGGALSHSLSRCLSSLYLKYASGGAEVVRAVSVCEVQGQSPASASDR